MAPEDSDLALSERPRVGGLAFFTSLFALIVISLLNLPLLPALFFGTGPSRLAHFFLGMLPGFFLAMYCIQGKYSVLVHEFKHSVISGLVGNRAKGLKINKDSGQFSYMYSRSTAAYNAFIALAPYWLPLFTTLSLLIAFSLWRANPVNFCIAVGVGYGTDLIMNLRDISPRQTDLTLIRGGYSIGLAYVIAMNLALLSFLLAGIMQGSFGLMYLVKSLWHIMLFLARLGGLPV
ncbi:MAG: M50 family metallopeptidase [Oligoflexia bacterium]|nr:M50 family metallopeptidase [Oligoflexia bacterium]